MPTASEHQTMEAPATGSSKRLYRSKTDRVIGGVAGGLGEYLAIDPIWMRIGFVLLAVTGGSGFLIYLIMWALVPEAPEGYQPSEPRKGSVPGIAIVGVVLMVVGSIALANTIAPSLGQYFWPAALLLGGLALVIGGFNSDDDR